MNELKIYKKALLHYQLSNFPLIGIIFKNLVFETCRGFCWYFENYNLEKDLPILWQLKPNLKCPYGYWYKPGLLKPRIELLKKAISDTKMHIEIERLTLEK